MISDDTDLAATGRQSALPRRAGGSQAEMSAPSSPGAPWIQQTCALALPGDRHGGSGGRVVAALAFVRCIADGANISWRGAVRAEPKEREFLVRLTAGTPVRFQFALPKLPGVTGTAGPYPAAAATLATVPCSPVPRAIGTAR